MTVASFGFRHGKPSTFRQGIDLLIDVRPLFGRNPYHNKALRVLRGDHPDVIADILKTPNFDKNYAKLLKRVERVGPGGDVYLGCTGGHHRSVYPANRIGEELGCPVVHLNYVDK